MTTIYELEITGMKEAVAFLKVFCWEGLRKPESELPISRSTFEPHTLRLPPGYYIRFLLVSTYSIMHKTPHSFLIAWIVLPLGEYNSP
jgi:hypothetical protein